MTQPKKERIGRFDFQAIEDKWRVYWEQMNLYDTGDEPGKPYYYVLDFFPYPSGSGLSVGHCRNYVPTCVEARFKRMNGYNVLHPMGWDAFGLPAENYAIKHGIHPSETTRQFSDNYRRQMKLVECSYDWAREINSTDPAYYRWTQWFFLLLFQRGLAYQAMGSQWWCPQCQTILANEQVENGRCWRCESVVQKKMLRQWYFKITEYAERLLVDLETVDWPEHIKLMQRNWIGRSEGITVKFKVASAEQPHELPVFTTRPDTLFGVTFLVLAPEHPMVAQIGTGEQKTAVSAYITQAQTKTEMERQTIDKEKTGVFTGVYAIHPLTGQQIPVWVADYVLPNYGTGVVMGVPAHDSRDFVFAQQFHLPMVEVVTPNGQAKGVDSCYSDEGWLIHSGPYSGMSSAAASQAITADLQTSGLGQKQTSYKMRDWLISRQRYWGAPIPIVHCAVCGIVPVPEDQLPVRLPDTHDFAPDGNGRSPLARISEWVNTTCPQCGSPAQRETDTMDGFACSSWYFLRFANPHYTDGPFDPEAVQKWLPVDLYVGGAEHAVMHLLYARFWTKVMYDAGLVGFVEPFTRLRNQGMLLAATGGKMSKSRGNVVTPDDVIAQFGTDALRAYVLFLGPFDAEIMWDDSGIRGITRFLNRYYHLAQQVTQTGEPKSAAPFQVVESFERERHKAVKRVTKDMTAFRFNTAVSALMEYLNYLETTAHTQAISVQQWWSAIETFTALLAPIAPFVTEEVWQTVLGHFQSIHQQTWPVYDEAQTADVEQIWVIQVNGKVRDRMSIKGDEPEAVVRETAVASPVVQKYLNGKPVRQIIVVPGKLVNIVT